MCGRRRICKSPRWPQPVPDPETGLVNCFYRLTNPGGAAMRWEAIAINADFWASVPFPAQV